MIVDDLDFMRSVCSPDETDAPLIVDADAVPAFPVCSERFQPIARRDSEFVKVDGSGKLIELPKSDRQDIAPAPALAGQEEIVRVATLERPYHP